jgi:hypothetical protein
MEVGTNPGQKRLRYRGVQGMKYSYERATWWLAILTVPKPYDGVLYRTDSVGGRVGCFYLLMLSLARFMR